MQLGAESGNGGKSEAGPREGPDRSQRRRARKSRMIGSIVVMEPTAYEAWLSGGQPGQSMTASGA